MASRDSVPMSEEHKERLSRNLPTLISSLNLSAAFWAILLSLMVVTSSEKQRIEGMSVTDEDRALALIEYLQKKSDECYYGFLNALRRTDQRHLLVILEDQGTEHALASTTRPTPDGNSGLTLRDMQLMIVRSLKRLCSTVETWTWAADKKYAPIDHMFTDLVWVKDMGHTSSLGLYTEMFKDEDDTPVSFVFLQGLAGSGKSTLVQMLNIKWCRHIERKWLDREVKLSDIEVKLFSEFNYVILILMRYVKEGQTLQEFIQQQYGLKPENAANLYGQISQNQIQTLFFMDGYDEYIESTCPEITNIAKRTAFRESTVVITSRHSVSYHFPEQMDRVYKPDNHILLRGFNSAGISQYIFKFFSTPNKGKATSLCTEIDKSDDLVKLARFPAILLLMCTLWEHENSLSGSITGFFLKFVAYVCGRYESKYVNPIHRAIARNIMKKYHGCLMKIGEVSVGGLREDKLKLSFLYNEVINQMGETAWQLGFLKRESNIEGDELVVFPHKTMQEFFTAFYVVNVDKIKQKELLVHFCSSVKAVKESEMIQTFISGLGGEEIKRKIDTIIHGSDRNDMSTIIPAIQLSYLAENRHGQLKLPPRILLEVNDKYSEDIYKQYLNNDCTAVSYLHVQANGFQSVTESAVMPALISMLKLTVLRFSRKSLSIPCLGSLCGLLFHQRPLLTTLDLVMAVGQDVHDAPWPTLMDSLPATLEKFKVSNNHITDESIQRLSQRLASLKQLQVIKMDSCNLCDTGAFLQFIKNTAFCGTLTEVSVGGNNLGDGLLEIVNLTAHMSTLRVLSLSHNKLSAPDIDRLGEQLNSALPKLELVLW